MVHQLSRKGTTFITTNIKPKFFFILTIDTLRLCFSVILHSGLQNSLFISLFFGLIFK